MKDQKFKVGDLVKFAAKWAPYNGDQIGVIVEVSVVEPLHDRYKIDWTKHIDHSPIWYAEHHLQRIR